MRRGENSREWREIGTRKWINAPGVATRRQLHQAQFGAVGSLSQKFRIEAYVIARIQLGSELGEGR